MHPVEPVEKADAAEISADAPTAFPVTNRHPFHTDTHSHCSEFTDPGRHPVRACLPDFCDSREDLPCREDFS